MSAFSLAGLLGCFGPSANGLLCSDNGKCPTGFACYRVGQELRCYDREPDTGVGGDAGQSLEAGASGDGASGTSVRDAGDATSGACGHILCEDFESPAALGRWGVTSYYSGVALDDTRAYRGGRSLHVNLLDPQTDPAYDPTHPVPSQGEIAGSIGLVNDVFMRVFVYIPSVLSTLDARIAAVQADQPDDYPSASVWINGNHLELTLPDSSTFESTTILKANEWTCLEWEVVVGNPGTVHAWLGGVEVQGSPFMGDTSLVGAARNQLAVVGAAVFGDHQRFQSYDLWFDELALDSTRIGCEN